MVWNRFFAPCGSLPRIIHLYLTTFPFFLHGVLRLTEQMCSSEPIGMMIDGRWTRRKVLGYYRLGSSRHSEWPFKDLLVNG